MSALAKFTGFAREPGTDKLYRLTQPLSFGPITAPYGRLFDCSVPKPLQEVQSPHDRRMLPACAVHDEALRRRMSKLLAARVFRRALIVRGFSRGRAWAYFFAVLAWTAVLQRQPRG